MIKPIVGTDMRKAAPVFIASGRIKLAEPFQNQNGKQQEL